MKKLISTVFFTACTLYASPLAQVDQWFEQIDQKFYWYNEKPAISLDISGQIDLTGMYRDNGGPPGFFFTSGTRRYDYASRLSLMADLYVGKSFYAFYKMRWDDGIHPGLGKALGDPSQTRSDVFFLRWSPLSNALNIQVGQFAPIFGNFLDRQETGQLGLVNYPMLYEQVSSVSDINIPTTPADFANRRNKPDNKLVWLPQIWAPAYTRGISFFGSIQKWEYSFNITNRSPSSRSAYWNDNTWSHPSYLMRIGYRPDPAWRFGLNASTGPYLIDALASALPPGRSLFDYRQNLIGVDFSYKLRKWEIWGEFYQSAFDIPGIEQKVRIWSYYLETRYRLTTSWWLSARWNQEWQNRIGTANGSERWDNPTYRIDAAIGWRPIRNWQIKFHYSYHHQDANFQNGEQFAAIETSLFF